MTRMTQSADDFIEQKRNHLVTTYRFAYHFMPEVGWMNDPNGFVQFRHTFHMFYQHYPYDAKWGPMHWGHATSPDLIRWTYEPVALAPDEAYDKDGCFSGSAVVADDTLMLFYTGHLIDNPATETAYHQVQNLAMSSDGVSFVKSPDNPIISEDLIPPGASQRDFRDPKVTQIGDTYYMVIGSNDGTGHGQALLYKSKSLTSWQFVNVLAKSDGRYGDNWECPDFFPLKDEYVLFVSPQHVDPKTYYNDNTTLYFTGSFDESAGQLQIGDGERMDYGFDFYAPQSTEDERGRRIVVGWMNTWGTEWPTQREGHGWVGALTLPRQVVQVGDRLHFRPLPEIEAYRQAPFEVVNQTFEGNLPLSTKGIAYELECDVSLNTASAFGICVRVGQHERTVLSYLTETETFFFDRDKSGHGPKGTTSVQVPLQNGHLHLRIFVDTASVEVFINDGERVMTGLIFPNASSDGLELFSEGQVHIRRLTKWDLVLA